MTKRDLLKGQSIMGPGVSSDHAWDFLVVQVPIYLLHSLKITCVFFFDEALWEVNLGVIFLQGKETHWLILYSTA